MKMELEKTKENGKPQREIRKRYFFICMIASRFSFDQLQSHNDRLRKQNTDVLAQYSEQKNSHERLAAAFSSLEKAHQELRAENESLKAKLIQSNDSLSSFVAKCGDLETVRCLLLALLGNDFDSQLTFFLFPVCAGQATSDQ